MLVFSDREGCLVSLSPRRGRHAPAKYEVNSSFTSFETSTTEVYFIIRPVVGHFSLSLSG